MISFPWDNASAEVKDRNVGSDVLAELFIHNVNNQQSGIFTPVGDMGVVTPVQKANTVSVTGATGAILGRLFSETDSQELTLDAPESTPRYDRIVIRLDRIARAIEFGSIKGIAAVSPTAPRLTRTSDIYEVCVATILRPVGGTMIQAAEIHDERTNPDVIDIIPVVGSIDMAGINNELNAIIAEYNDIVKAALDESIAGQLQNQITANEDAIAVNAGAIAEVSGAVGDLSALPTEDKSSVVGSLIETYANSEFEVITSGTMINYKFNNGLLIVLYKTINRSFNWLIPFIDPPSVSITPQANSSSIATSNVFTITAYEVTETILRYFMYSRPVGSVTGETQSGQPAQIVAIGRWK